jgi:hypothetical protein
MAEALLGEHRDIKRRFFPALFSYRFASRVALSLSTHWQTRAAPVPLRIAIALRSSGHPL